MQTQIKKIFLILFFLSSSSSFAISKVMFMSPAHMLMGNDVKLRFAAGEPGETQTPLHLPNGLIMTYGDILAMPDFYGIMDPVAFGKNNLEKKQRFRDSFFQLAEKKESYEEAKKIRSIINEEYKWVLLRMEEGLSSEAAYKKAGYIFDMQFNCTTGGGGCKPSDVWWMKAGRYLNLSAVNFDHFGDNALITYEAGHKLALEQAVYAHQTGNIRGLELAYAMNAFACHFLSDRFAAGHIRTPRVELSTKTFSASVGSLLAIYMHDEENMAGLHVHNQRGDHWIAYGDKSWFNPKIEMHKKILHEALQYSADAIFEAYQRETINVNDKVMELVPIPDETGYSGSVDIAPLFYWDEPTKLLVRRHNVFDLNDRHWIHDWLALPTLALVNEAAKQLSGKEQAMLYISSYRHEAEKAGFIPASSTPENQ